MLVRPAVPFRSTDPSCVLCLRRARYHALLEEDDQNAQTPEQLPDLLRHLVLHRLVQLPRRLRHHHWNPQVHQR